MIPRRSAIPFAAIGGLAAVLVGVAVLSHGRVPDGPPPGVPLQSADLVLQDRDDGSIAVFDAGSHRLVDVVPPATNGFLRVVLAGLVRERRREGEGAPGIAFHLARWPGGRLTIDDIATHRLIDLEAFGPANAGAFGHLLDESAAAQPCAGAPAAGACSSAGRDAAAGK